MSLLGGDVHVDLVDERGDVLRCLQELLTYPSAVVVQPIPVALIDEIGQSIDPDRGALEVMDHRIGEEL